MCQLQPPTAISGVLLLFILGWGFGNQRSHRKDKCGPSSVNTQRSNIRKTCNGAMRVNSSVFTCGEAIACWERVSRPNPNRFFFPLSLDNGGTRLKLTWRKTFQSSSLFSFSIYFPYLSCFLFLFLRGLSVWASSVWAFGFWVFSPHILSWLWWWKQEDGWKRRKKGLGEEEGRELAFQLKLATRPLPARTLASPRWAQVFQRATCSSCTASLSFCIRVLFTLDLFLTLTRSFADFFTFYGKSLSFSYLVCAQRRANA